MDFFAHQESARRKTGVLVFYFILAVILILTAIIGAVYGLLYVSGYAHLPFGQWLRQPWWLAISGAVLLVMLGGSLIRSASLRGGGVSLNQMLGARPILPDTTDSNERRLVNVVEEMAIASGMPVPILFILDEEPAINAFVAGFTPNTATLTVTRGTLEQLSRDELQGVVGHEFSHILNGDMRINLRLIGVLAGILAISQIGTLLLRGSSNARIRVRSSNSRSGGSEAAFLIGLGLALAVIGWFGLFFGRLIKAAISRQREFLADASSVQFTRNPDGIVGALHKIEQTTGQARLHNAHAEDMSHMCFGSSIKLSALLATHPPIAERIKAVKGRYVAPRKSQAASEATGAATAPATAFADIPVAGFTDNIAIASRDLMASVGNPTPQHVDYAQALLARLPDDLRQRLQHAHSASSLILALLLAAEPDADAAQAVLAGKESRERLEEIRALVPVIAELGAAARLPLAILALPALRQLDSTALMQLRHQITLLIRFDNQLSLFESLLLLILDSQLLGNAGANPAIRSYHGIVPELSLVFAQFVEFASPKPEARLELFQRILRGYTRELPPQPMVRPEAFSAALKKLSRLVPLLKQGVLTSCVDCVMHDGRLSVTEAELLRTVSVVLDCPMPPLMVAPDA